jgi:hypothetical protein
MHAQLALKFDKNVLTCFRNIRTLLVSLSSINKNSRALVSSVVIYKKYFLNLDLFDVCHPLFFKMHVLVVMYSGHPEITYCDSLL